MNSINAIKLNKTDFIIALVLLLFSGFLIFFKINSTQLQDWDEGIYANIAGDMVENNHWFNMQFSGTDWYEKEILPYWLMALSIKNFGFTVFAVRLPFTIISIFLVPLFYLITRYYLNKILSLATSLLFLFSPYLWISHVLRTGDFDALALTFFLAAIVSYLYLREKKFFWVSSIFISLSIMSRGVMGYLFLTIILISELIRPKFKLDKWKIKKVILYLTISILPWLLWHFYWLLQGGQKYIDVYWKDQFFNRITTPLQGHYGDFYYYFNIISKFIDSSYVFIFFVGIILTLFFTLKKNWKFFFLLIWLTITLVPLQIIHTKLYWYLLPALPVLYLTTIASLSKIAQPLFIKYKKATITIVSIIFISHILIFSTMTFGYITKNNTQNYKNFIKNAMTNIPNNEHNIVLYNSGNNEYININQRLRWYLYYENNKQIKFATTKSIEKNPEEYLNNPYWIANQDGLKEINNLNKQFTYSKLYSDGDFTLIKIKSL